VSVAVIPYHRDNAIYDLESLVRTAERHSNLIALKDGVGDLLLMLRLRARLGERLSLLGGLPSADVFALPFRAAGYCSYSSAVFDFIPRASSRFFKAVYGGDEAAAARMLNSLFLPLAEFRSRRRISAPAIQKGGLRVLGRGVGPVRPPLADMTAQEDAELRRILDAALDGKPN
jgi:5-dehydro-4-deoxyglucarate dehydratase